MDGSQFKFKLPSFSECNFYQFKNELSAASWIFSEKRDVASMFNSTDERVNETFIKGFPLKVKEVISNRLN